VNEGDHGSLNAFSPIYPPSASISHPRMRIIIIIGIFILLCVIISE
jgi:hypothetical protein